MFYETQELIFEIRSLGSSGEGVASYEGFTFFIDGALPGEQVKGSISSLKKRYGTAKLTEVLRPSPSRRAPPCPVFSRCGGCQIMHCSYPQQLVLKRQKVCDALQRIAHLDWEVAECVASTQEWHYRHKIQLPVEGDVLGLYAKNSHNIVPVDACLIHCQRGEEICQSVRSLLKKKYCKPGLLRHLLLKTSLHSKESLLAFITREPGGLENLAAAVMEACPSVAGVMQAVNNREDNVILGEGFTCLAGRPFITEKILDTQFQISAGAFFQVNAYQLEPVFKKVLEEAQLKPSDVCVDAFCGVGTFSLLAARYAHKVIGIECVPTAIDDAIFNAQLNGINNVEFICNTAEKAFSQLANVDLVFLNPPRKGCAEVLLETIAKKRIPRIVYMSCNPATLARDLRLLYQHGYLPNSPVTPFDLFPQTTHVESTVSLLFNHQSILTTI